MEKMDGMSMDLTKENIEKIKELFPNAVTEGKIDFDALRNILGEEVDNSKEKYQFTWSGKSESIRLSQSPSATTLRPVVDKSDMWDDTKNLYIEGDNLEVLKQLQKTFFSRIKMIYIDPPYNTGKDFVYKDNFVDSIQNYEEQTNQGMKSNPETSGRFHTDWLNMLYPRLILARNLLTEDGAIFVSIDDNEQTNMKKMLEDIFGEPNKVAEFVVIRAEGGGLAKQVIKGHDYLFVYAKDISRFRPLGRPKDIRGKIIEKDGEKYWIQEDWLRKEFGKYGNCHYEEILEFKGQEKLDEINMGLKNGQYVLIPKDNGMNIVGRLRNIREDSSKFYTVLKHLSAKGIEDLKELGMDKYFDYPKPVSLLKEIISGITMFSNDKEDIVLDFFSGSATTAQAVMELNAEDNGNRRFIMVQLPEMIEEGTDAYKDGFRNICDIGEERIRRAAKKVESDWDNKNLEEGLLADSNENFAIDTGFKVFRLDSTNINPWDNTKEHDEQTIFDTLSIFKLDRGKEDILYEIMLKYGIFDQPATEVDVNGKTMYRVGQRHMIVCLEDNIDDKDIEEIGKLEPRVVVFKEDGFKDDNAKINAEYNLKKAGVEDVKAI